MVNKGKLLQEIEQLNRDFWSLEEDSKKLYQDFLKAKNKYIAMKQVIGKLKEKILEKPSEYYG